MKATLILFILTTTLAVARADLVLQQQSVVSNVTYSVALKLHGDKMRMDQQDSQGRIFCVVVDLKTRDSLTLMPREKLFLKKAGTATNRVATYLPAKPVTTGTSEKVGGYDTEIYIWSGTNGTKETLWVAKDFPNFDQIKPELVKIDEFKNAGEHPAAHPDVSQLPGMVVKNQTETKGRRVTIALVSAKIEPVDPAQFELPADYKEYQPLVITPVPNNTK